MGSIIAFIDSEISKESGAVCDLGAINTQNKQFHSANKKEFSEFVSNAEYVCGHNIIHHDMKYIGDLFNVENPPIAIDTLYLSPLLFPRKPYHKLLKDDKLQTETLNNPLNDSIKARDLFFDEINAFSALPNRLKWIFCSLLYPFPEFQGFFKYHHFKPYPLNEQSVKAEFEGKICANANLLPLMQNYPIELAYSLAIIACDDKSSITPPWVLKNYPKVENVIKLLRHMPCASGCEFCKEKLDVRRQLKRIFGFDNFRTYNGEPLQENAADAAVKGKSLLAVFPTGGGKSITFQLPALIAGETVHGLTVVLSPLQSLMKDQVDNLEEKGITDAVTINGLLSPIERAEAIERVANGTATLLYISPEQLRSKTIEKLLLSRNISRFVIDEAHCFSAWGQDFRVDYLYIGEFIKNLQNQKGSKTAIPVSCFTATAKQKVIADICDYFKKKLDLDLELFASSATRENLHYAVLYKETEDEKYNGLRALIEARNCPTIVYVSRTRTTIELAEKLTNDGFPAKPFNGKMESAEKIVNQEAFIRNQIQVIVATSAFGMGVDKKDVKLVIHYDISDSLENYVQEAGRAGRDQSLNAECFVLYNDKDLDQHFMLLNQTKLSFNEIQQVWKAIKDLSKTRQSIICSPLEIARQAGWDDSVPEIETRIKTAISALENAGYVKRGRNVPRVYATSILANNMQEAAFAIETSDRFSEPQKTTAKRIIKFLISSRSIAKAGNDEAESRIDYISDKLGLDKSDVIESINLMREIGLLADSQDMSAYIHKSDSINKSLLILEKFIKLENYLLSQLSDETESFNLKELNDNALNDGISSTIKNIRTILYFWTIKGYIQKGFNNSQNKYDIVPNIAGSKLFDKFHKRIDICKFILNELFEKGYSHQDKSEEEIPVLFSLVGLFQTYNKTPHFNLYNDPVSTSDIAEALLYLSKIKALNLQGGFLVLYNGMEIKRVVMDNKIRYKSEDYRLLNDFYKQKIQQIHIVGEYANLMVKDYNAALQFVNDYFQMDFRKFISKYFEGERAAEIGQNIRPEKYRQLFGGLSAKQSEIIHDSESRYIVVAAGPGSGKTKILVHKLAALLLMEDVKHEQLLMLTFSRASATEFKKRLIELIGASAYYVEIKTFHSYCFDLLGKIGSIEESDNVVKNAAEMISNGEVELGRITKSVLVIDEAQDMDENEFALIKALIRRNEDMRLIAVGDDDQTIYGFRGADSSYFKSFVSDYGARIYEMTENYRSKEEIVTFANYFADTISERMKSLPGKAVEKTKGVVQLVHHNSRNMEEAIALQIANGDSDQTTCVLTNTNDEALRVVSMLNKYGCQAKLIQSIDSFFQLKNLIEIRFFLEEIDKKTKCPVISKEIWEAAKERLITIYKTSTCLDNCLRMIEEFESINDKLYRTDLQEFIKESNYEDFYKTEKGVIFVSTIHKSKGREFDRVFMLLNNDNVMTDANKRKIYVGITRAKNELRIHYNNVIFKNPPLEIIEDNNAYNTLNEIDLQLTHKDVVLDYFKNKVAFINRLRSGETLQKDETFLTATYNREQCRVLKFSQACIEKLNKLTVQGYSFVGAKIRYIVLWKSKDDAKEIPIILPQLYLTKNKI